MPKNMKVDKLKEWVFQLFNSKWEVHAFAWGFLGWMIIYFHTVPGLKTLLVVIGLMGYGVKGVQGLVKWKFKRKELPVSIRKEPLRYLLGLAVAMLTIAIYENVFLVALG